MTRIPVHSILKTFQGEGYNVGKPAVLVRVMGCNYTCPFCDVSDSSWNMNIHMVKYLSAKELVTYINTPETKNITLLMLTGGEPTLYMKEQYHKDFWYQITEKWFQYNDIRRKDGMIDVETNGSYEDYSMLPTFLYLPNPREDLQVSISPKIFESSFRNYKDIKNFDDITKFYADRLNARERRRWNFRYIFKFVLDPDNDENIKRIETLIDVLDIPRRQVFIMPITPNEKLKNFKDVFIDKQLKTLDYCIKNGFSFVPRLHIYIYRIFDNKEYEYHKIL
jgi:hypothetical protein